MARNQFANPISTMRTRPDVWFETCPLAQWPDLPQMRIGQALFEPKSSAVYRCAASTCRKDFTVMTGTVMERSHAKLTQWAAAFHMGASSKKGFSAHQLHRELGCQYNTAWFLHHRVMEAMRRGGLEPPLVAKARLWKPTKPILAKSGSVPAYAQSVGSPVFGQSSGHKINARLSRS